MPLSDTIKTLIRNAWDDGYPCLVATNGKEGPNITPKGSMIVFDDGHLDLYVTGYGGNVLYRNLGDCKFEDVTEKAGVRGGGFSTGAGWSWRESWRSPRSSWPA